MKIRLAEMKDIPDICNLYKDFFVYNASQQPQYYKQALELGKYPQSVIENTEEDIYVAVENNILVGMIHIIEEKTPPYDCYVQHRYTTIMDLFVTAEFRGRGIGGELLEAARKWAETRNLDYIELNALAENENGIQFYIHRNFKTVSQIMRFEL